MLNIEKYKDEILEDYRLNNMDGIEACMGYIFEKHNKGEFSHGVALLDWLCSEYKESILDDVEREYLKAVCKPFRNRTKDIQKLDDGLEQCIFINLDDQSFSLPSFKRRTMYKGMELDKCYALEELGITYDDEVKNTTITNNGTLNIKL